jgi:two-component system response regulator PilR (NtrC family)
VAVTDASVLLMGESGTGKSQLARYLHFASKRAPGPLAEVHCAALPETLLESELFGHEKGAFTGAQQRKLGHLAAADGGTLFLDEIAELPLPMQVKLLRAIQEKSVRPVGAHGEVPVDVRILSATHKDLAALVADGSFRHDLYYRINVIGLRVPPLRERREDLPQLAADVLARLSKDQGRVAPARLGDDALAALQAYPFPGNVRELENILERALAMADGDAIAAADLALPAVEPTHGRLPAAPPAPAPAGALAPSAGTPAAPAGAALPSYIEDLERKAIEEALQANRYNKTKAAASLGITFRALRYKLKKLGID